MFVLACRPPSAFRQHCSLVTASSGVTPAVAGSTKGSLSQITNSILEPGMRDFLNGQTPDATWPKAYLNWVLLDEDCLNRLQETWGATQVPVIVASA